ncbi:hypothetical protein GCM10017044_08490 [Kordiimonas sediminis]|uniref:Uncharacterized protein n=1 Tax=Kordiimonas sediminis TaxID=1735581 RepID=A0A919AP74_9PROT|nr:hypothetical protein GCM10017044_08490 [Kordiimonas sediminis]
MGNPTEGLCEGDCESLYSLNALVIGFFMMIGAAIAAGGLVGAFWAFLRRRRQADGFEAMLRDGKDKDQGSTGT